MRGKTNQDFRSIVKIRKIIFRDVITISFLAENKTASSAFIGEKKSVFNGATASHV